MITGVSGLKDGGSVHNCDYENQDNDDGSDNEDNDANEKDN